MATTTTFNATGSVQTYVVPAGQTSLIVECYGAQGAQYSSRPIGKGGHAKATIEVTPGETLYVYVGLSGGNGGWGGSFGGSPSGLTGGGSSEVRRGGTSFSKRVIVAGGGGGSGSHSSAAGGHGGGLVGGAGQPSGGGGGGTQSAGGDGSIAQDGTQSAGGDGFSGSGGGGGGYWGGGGGVGDAGGGGGSSYLTGTDTSTTTGVRSGDGLVKITTTNSPPNAPIVSDQGPFNRDVVNQVNLGAFSDPDLPNDSPSAWEHRYQPNGTSSWTLVEIDNPNNYWDAPAGTYVEDLYEAQSRSADQQGAWGPWSTSFFITAGDAPAGATILAPTSGATIPTSTVTVDISAADVDEAEYRLYADDGAGNIDLTTQLHPAVVKTTGDLRSHTWTGLDNNVPIWIWVRVKHDGLWQAEPTTQRNPVSYTPPPDPALATAPVLTLPLPNPDAIEVAISNPAPGTGEPAVAYNDLFVRAPNGDDPYRPNTEEGTRIAHMLLPNTPVTDERLPAGVDYEYRVVAHGDNGTIADSGWIN